VAWWLRHAQFSLFFRSKPQFTHNDQVILSAFID
jgi:hypothetical protein